MYPILILRAEIVSLIILLFLAFSAIKFNMGKDSKIFARLISFAILHVIFDIITVLTVNNLDIVPSWINKTAYVLFYFSAILFAKEILQYSINKYYPKIKNKWFYLSFIPVLIYAALLPILKFNFDQYDGTWLSGGSTFATVGFILGLLYFIAAYILTLKNYKKQTPYYNFSMIIILSILIVSEIIQMIYKPFLFTGCAITIVSIGFFFTLENPVFLFEKKLMIDSLTGVGSRHNYDQKLAELEKEFLSNKDNTYTVAFCDINNLKSVNNSFGHIEGDHYISIVSTSIISSIKSTTDIFRIGGDEFVIIYKDIAENVVIEELEQINKLLETYDNKLSYSPGLSISYAISNDTTTSIKDLVQTADFAMFESKAKAHINNLSRIPIASARINPIGLEETLFDSYCKLANDSYVFITNFNTHVSRLSPSFASKFNFENNYVYNFHLFLLSITIPEDSDPLNEEFFKIKEDYNYHTDFNFRVKNSDNTISVYNLKASMLIGSGLKPDLFLGIIKEINSAGKE